MRVFVVGECLRESDVRKEWNGPNGISHYESGGTAVERDFVA